MKKHHLSLQFVLVVILFCFVNIAAQNKRENPPPADAEKSASVANLRLHQLTSKIFENTRTIRVLLPPGYEEPGNRKKKYPVLYLNDGQNLFEASTSLFNPIEWQVDETVRLLIEKREIEPLIVVGIDNAGSSGRANEYLPYEDKYLQPPLPNPDGNKYPDFLTQEVMPFINQRYRTKTGAKNTVLGGSSYGALISLYAFIKKPEVFGSLLLESPSFYVSDAQILKEAENLRKLPRKIYLGVGTNEEGRANCTPGNMETEAVQDVLKLKRILQGKKLGEKKLKVLVENCAVHNENAWAKRLPEALKFLYKTN